MCIQRHVCVSHVCVCIYVCVYSFVQMHAVVSTRINKVDIYCLIFTEVDVKKSVNIYHKECNVTFLMKQSKLLAGRP